MTDKMDDDFVQEWTDLEPGVEAAILDTCLYLGGSSSPLEKLAQHASVEACLPPLPEWERAALYNAVLTTKMPWTRTLGGPPEPTELGALYSLAEVRQVVRHRARSIDHQYEFMAGLL